MKQELLQTLQQKIKGVSCNSLRRVYPSEIQEWVGANDKEAEQFIRDLLNERLIAYKYDFRCSCGNNCTAYYRNLEINPYRCNECERVYDFTEISQNSTLVCELDKQAILEYNKNPIDYKDIVKETNKVVVMPVKREENMDKKKVFIGSSSTKTVMDKMEVVARIIDDIGGEALPWNAKGKGLFVAGQYTFDSLVKIAKRVDGAIFMFDAEDMTWYSDKCALKKAVRDNVLLEYGLFAGTLGADKVTFICSGEPKIATDLLGVTYIKGEQSEYQIKPDLQDWFAQI
jgi:predicted nucleotide-binding protein